MKKILIILLIILSFGLTSCQTIYDYFNPTSATKTSKTSKVTPSETTTNTSKSKDNPTSTSTKDTPTNTSTSTSSTPTPTTSEPTGQTGTTTHEHEFESSWSYDDEYHYHNSTCGHDVKDGVERHDYNVTVSANTLTYTCKVCGRTYTKEASININKLYGYNYFKNNNPTYTTLYEKIFEACVNFNSENQFVSDKMEVNGKDCYYFASIDFSELGLSVADTTSVWETFYIENPQFYYLSSQILYSDSKLHLTISEEYLDPTVRNTINNSLNTLFQTVSEVLRNASTSLEKIYLLHDYILSNMEYAFKDDGITPEDAVWAHNIVGFINNHKGVCESYSKIFIYLSRLFDIDNIAVTGNSRNQQHMWNLAKVDDTWYEFDFTWDDNATTDYRYNYFALSEEAFSVDHTANGQTLGINYLYPLPEVSDKSMNLVKLYNSSTYLGLYKSINDAALSFEEDKDYEIQLINYFGREKSNAIDDREYELASFEKKYNNLKILGFKNISTDDGSYYMPEVLKLIDDVTLDNNTLIENLILDSNEHSLKVKKTTLTLKDYVNVKIPITDEDGTIICDSTLSKVEFNNSLTITNLDNILGQNVISSNANITNLTVSYARSAIPKTIGIIFKNDNTTINIENIIYKNSVSRPSQVTLFVSGEALNSVLSIGNILKDTTSSYSEFTFNVFTNELDKYPDVRFNNDISITINYIIRLDNATSLEKENFVGKKILKTTSSNKYKLVLAFHKTSSTNVEVSKLSFDSDGYLILSA